MLNYRTPNYYRQELNVKNITIPRDRFFIDKFKNKKVLHIGCAGGDIFYSDKETNLHVKLINSDIDVDGLDIRKDIIDKLNEEFPNNDFYSSPSQVLGKKYDVVLVPEVLEHVDNARGFLDEIFSIKSDAFFITVPNCEGLFNNFSVGDGDNVIELIHPEHYYWFSAYTLFNITKKYINKMEDADMFYLSNKTSIAIEIKI